MGLTGISPLSLLLIFAIFILLFGTDKLRSLGRDLGVIINDFRQSMDEDKKDDR